MLVSRQATPVHLLTVLFLLGGPDSVARAQSIVTVAGGGSDEGRTALARNLNQPYHMAIDGAGNLYVADYGNNRILRISVSTGLTTTVAGNGVYGFSGDGGPATRANLARPYGLAIDGSGNLFISDYGNNRVRRVSASTGVISTVAGGGTGDDGKPAVEASLSGPCGVAVDGAGNLYIADRGRHRVRKVAASTGIISTVAGNGTSGHSGDGGPATAAAVGYPSCVALDAAGNILVGENWASIVRKVSASTGTITTVAGTGTSGFRGDGGPATSAWFSEIWGVKVDRAGNVLIADSANNRIRRVSASTGIVTTIAGNGTHSPSGDGGPATAAGIYWPEGIAIDGAGDLYVSEAGAGRVRRVSAATGAISTIAGGGSCGDGGPALSAILAGPTGVAVDRAGNLHVVDGGNHRVRVVAAFTGTITTIAGNGVPGLSGDGGPGVNASLDTPYKLALDEAGSVYIADTVNDRIRKVAASTGVISTFAGGGTGGDGEPANRARLESPLGITVDGVGNVYVTEMDAARVRKVAAGSGIITTVAGTGNWGFSGDGGPATAAMLRPAWGVALDPAGDLFIADKSNGRVRKVTASTGVVTTVAGGGRATTEDPRRPRPSRRSAWPWTWSETSSSRTRWETGSARSRVPPGSSPRWPGPEATSPRAWVRGASRWLPDSGSPRTSRVTRRATSTSPTRTPTGSAPSGPARRPGLRPSAHQPKPAPSPARPPRSRGRPSRTPSPTRSSSTRRTRP